MSLLTVFFIFLTGVGVFEASADTQTISSPYTLTLKKGVNLVSIPLSINATATSNTIENLFDGVMDRIKTIKYYDSAAGEWLLYDPSAAATSTLETIPNGSSFYIETKDNVTTDTTVAIYGTAVEFLTPALHAGWNEVGVAKEITVADFATGVSQFNIQYDSIYRIDEKGNLVTLKLTDKMSPGKGYWLDNDPDEDGVSSADELGTYASMNGSPLVKDLKVENNVVSSRTAADTATVTSSSKVDFLESRCGIQFSLTSGQSLDDLYKACSDKKAAVNTSYDELVKDYPVVGEDVTLKDKNSAEAPPSEYFTIKQVRYQTDNSGKKVAGIGVVDYSGFPESLKPLFALEGGSALVLLDLKDEKVFRAVSETITGIVLGQGTGSVALKGEDAEFYYLTISTDGGLEVGLTAKAGKVDNLPERTYFVRWSPPATNKTNFIQLSMLLGEEEKPGDEVIASMVWKTSGNTGSAWTVNGNKWFLNVPLSTTGVFEPVVSFTEGTDITIANSASPFTYSDPPGPGDQTVQINFTSLPGLVKKSNTTWLPAAPEVSKYGDKDVITFKAAVKSVNMVSAMGSTLSDLWKLGTATLNFDESGKIYTSATKPRHGFEKGALVVDFSPLKFYFKGFTLKPNADISLLTRFALSWSPSAGLSLGYQSGGVLKDVSAMITVEPEIAFKLYEYMSADANRAVSQLVPGGNLKYSANLRLNFDGYETGVSAEGYMKSEALVTSATKTWTDAEDPSISKEVATSEVDRMMSSGLKLTFPVVQHAKGNVTFVADLDQRYMFRPKDSSLSTQFSFPKMADAESYESRIELVGEGRYTLPDGIPVVGGNDLAAKYRGVLEYAGPDSFEKYKYEAQTTVSLSMAQASNATSLGNSGWNLSLDELKVEFDKTSIRGVDEGMFGQFQAVLGYMNPSTPKGMSKMTASVTLTPPNGFIAGGPFTGLFKAEKAEDAGKDKSSTAAPVWNYVIVAGMNTKIPLGGESEFILLKDLIASKTGEANWTFMATAECHIGERIIAGDLIIQADGVYTLIIQGYKLNDTFKSVDLMLSLNKGSDGKWKYTVSLGGVISGKDIASLLGQDATGISADLLFRGMLSSDKLTLQLGNMPINWKGLPDWIIFDKIKDVTYTKNLTGNGDWSFNFAVDILFKHFCDDNVFANNRAQCPRFTFGAFYSPNAFTISGRNIGPIPVKDGASITITELSGGQGAETAGGEKKFKFTGSVKLRLPNSLMNLVANYATLPREVDATYEYADGGFLLGFMFSDSPKISIGGGIDLKIKKLLIKKASPWSIGLESGLSVGGKEYMGTIGLGDNKAMFSLPPEVSFTMPIPGFPVKVSNFAIELGKTPALAGDVIFTVPSGDAGNVIRSLIGQEVAMALAGSATEFRVGAKMNKASTMNLGPLGNCGIAFKEISIDSKGAFAGFGSLTLGGKTVDFTTAMQGTNFTFMADFGDDGINVKVAQIFMLKIKNKIGLGTMGPFQYFEIDDGMFKSGVDLAGMDLATQRFLYFLPTAVPPVGFAFFDNLDGNAHIVGFAINIGLNFPAPKPAELVPTFTVLKDALSKGKFDEAKANKLSAPAFAIHDVALQFPKVPGYTWKDGGIKYTDNMFAAMFGSNNLTIVDKLALKPRDFMVAATAVNPVNLLKVIIPKDKRKGSKQVNITGFSAGLDWDLRDDETLYEKKTIAKLPDMYNFVQKVKYVNDHSGTSPEELQQGDLASGAAVTEINKWKGNSPGIHHQVGQWGEEAWNSTKPSDAGKAMLYGPYIPIKKGDYRVAFEIKSSDNKTVKDVVCIDSSVDGGRVLASKCLTGPDFGSPNQYQTFYLDFNVEQDRVNFEMRVWPAAVASLSVKSVSLARYDNVWRGNSPGIQHQVGQWGDGAWNSTKPSDAGQAMWYGPYMPLKKGNYRVAFEIKSSDNQIKNDLVCIDAVHSFGNNKLAGMCLAGIDFRFANQYQKFYLDFSLEKDISNLETRVWTAGVASLSVRSVKLSTAGSAKTSEIVMPSEYGGGKAKVRWQVADIKEELKGIKELRDFITPGQNSNWKQHLKFVWEKLVQKSGMPVFDGNRAKFPYSADMAVELEFGEYDEELDISGLAIKNNALSARFGTVTLYKDPDFKGASWTATDDMPFSVITSTPIGNDGLSSVKIEGNGKATLFEGHLDQSASNEITKSKSNLSRLGWDNVASAVRIFYPVGMDRVTKWRIIAKSSIGIITTVDSGGMEVTFPKDVKLLSLLPNSRLANALEDTKKALNEMKPYPALFSSPQSYLSSQWSGRLLPLKDSFVTSAKEVKEGQERPVSFRRSDGTVLSLTPYKAAPDRTVTGVQFDKSKGVLLLKTGKVTLYEHANFEGKALELTSDITDLSKTSLGNDIASSMKAEDGGIATLFTGTNFTAEREWDQAPGELKQVSTYDAYNIWGVNSFDDIFKWTGSTWQNIPGKLKYVSAGPNGTAMGVNSSDEIFYWNGGSWSQVTPGAGLKQIALGGGGLGGGRIWGVNSNDDIFRYVRTVEMKNICIFWGICFPYPQPVEKWEQVPGKLKQVSVSPYGDVWGTNSVDDIYGWSGSNWNQLGGKLRQVSIGGPGILWGTNSGGEIYKWGGNNWVKVPGGLKHVSVANDGTVWGVNASNAIYRKVSRGSTGTIEQSPWLGDAAIGDNTVRSAQVFIPTDMNGLKEWKLSQSIPSGGQVQALLKKKTGGPGYESSLSTVLTGSDNSIRTVFDNSGGMTVTPVSANRYEYPLQDYKLYVRNEPVDIKDIFAANKYVRIITKTITMPDGTMVTVNDEGGMTARYAGTDITPADVGSASSVFSVVSADNRTLKFTLDNMGGGFGSAVVSGSKPVEVVEIYDNQSGDPVGYQKKIGQIEGGFFANAHLNAGSANVVQINLNVSGAIKTDGNFYFKGNGDLVIANFTVSEAVVELSSQNGLYIRGKIDLFGATKIADIEGYLKPNGEFSFNGTMQLMAAGTGIKGVIVANNGGIDYNGGLYIANYKITGGSFHIDPSIGRINWNQNIGIGWAGVEMNTWLQLKPPMGAGFTGRAYVDINIPIKIWGPGDYDCCCWGCICWPTDWGWHQVGTLSLHKSISVSASIVGTTVGIDLSIARINVDLKGPSLSVSY